MSSNNVESPTCPAGAGSHPPSGRTNTGGASHKARLRRAWPIARRLTLLYLAMTAALLLLAGGFLYLALQRSLDARDRALLASKVRVLRVLLSEQTGRTDLLVSEIEHESVESPLRYYLRVLDPRDGRVIETPGMEEILPVTAFPSPSKTGVHSPDSIQPHVRRRGSFLLLSVQCPLGDDGEEVRVMQVGLDISPDLKLLADYRRTLLLVLGMGLGVAAAGGAWVASRGLTPLADISRAARQISASRLHERIVAAQWPRELAELADHFNAMLDRLEDSFTRLAQFSGDLAHELRTPIHNLRGEAEVALSRSRSIGEYQETLASSLEELDRLTCMIDGLLFLARSDNPQVGIECVDIDAQQETRAVLEFHEAQAEEQGVRLSVEGHARLTADPSLFRRALSNLLTNALQHTPPGGSIVISLKEQLDRGVEIRVHDTGTGIPVEHLSRVFDRFYRVDRSRTGVGLGLAIVHSIMRLHGGEASAHRDPEGGTTLALWFPMLPPSAPPTERPPRGSSGIDPNPGMR